jgi:hypothetical protein
LAGGAPEVGDCWRLWYIELSSDFSRQRRHDVSILTASDWRVFGAASEHEFGVNVIYRDCSREAVSSRLTEHGALSILPARGLDQRNTAYCTYTLASLLFLLLVHRTCR